eukprot:8183255-Alexandrium_andersonii.AAC.1
MERPFASKRRCRCASCLCSREISPQKVPTAYKGVWAALVQRRAEGGEGRDTCHRLQVQGP